MTELKFVNIAHPADIHQQRDVQTEIRRHVMKDVVKQRRRTEAREEVALVPTKKRSRNDDWLFYRSHQSSVPYLKALPHVDSFPIDRIMRSMELVSFAVGVVDGYVPFWKIWFDLSSKDSSFFKISIGSAADYSRKMSLNQRLQDNLKISRYYGFSLPQLRKCLVDPLKSMSEGIIINILSHICLSLRQADWSSWRAHMKGLELVYKARGGFEDINDNAAIMIFVHNINAGILFDTPPQFPVPRCIYKRETPPRDLSPKLQALLQRLQCPSFSDTVAALRMVSTVAAEVNLSSHSATFWRRDIDALSLIGPCIHFLLSMRRLPEDIDIETSLSELIVSEMVRLASLSIMSELRDLFMMSIDEGPKLHDSFDRLIASYGRHIGRQHIDLRTWAIATVALIRGHNSRDLLVGELQAQMQDVSKESAYAVIGTAREIIWVNILESPSADELAVELVHGA